MGAHKKEDSIRSFREKYGYSEGNRLYYENRERLKLEAQNNEPQTTPEAPPLETPKIETPPPPPKDAILEQEYRPTENDTLKNLLTEIETETVFDDATPETPKKETQTEILEDEFIDDSDSDFDDDFDDDFDATEETGFENSDNGDGRTKSRLSAEFVSGLFISALSWVNDFACPILYDQYAFTPSENGTLKYMSHKFEEQMKSKKKFDFDQYTPEEYELLNQFKKAEEYKRRVPFTDEEKENMRIPLEMMFENTAILNSPMSAFVIAVGLICFSRTAPIWWASREKKQRNDKKENERREKEREEENFNESETEETSYEIIVPTDETSPDD